MARVESGVSQPEINRMVLLGPDNKGVELKGASPTGEIFLSGVRTALIAAMEGGLIEAAPLPIDSSAVTLQAASKQAAEAPQVGSELTLADLRTPNHFREYFVNRLRLFLDQEVELALPSQEYVDRGNRIKDAGFTTYEPVVFPNLMIEQDFAYPANWEFPLDPWIYGRIERKYLKPDVLVLRELWGWLDTSVRLDWKSGDPMFDENMDSKLGQLLADLRAKGEKDGIAVSSHIIHLDPRSVYGVSADETARYVYPALAKMFGVGRSEVTDLTAAQFNFVGNWQYRQFGERTSCEWHGDVFEVGGRLIGGLRGGGGLSFVGYYPSGDRFDISRFRPLVVSPSRS